MQCMNPLVNLVKCGTATSLSFSKPGGILPTCLDDESINLCLTDTPLVACGYMDSGTVPCVPHV